MDPASQVVKNCGGLRLYETITKKSDGSSIYKTYKYGINESGYGNLPLIPSVANMSDGNSTINYINESSVTGLNLSYKTRTYSADVNSIFSYIAQKPVIYTEVVEYLGTGTATTGKTLYRYDYDDQIAPNSFQDLYLNRDYKYWKNSSLIDKVEYKNNNGTYTQAKSIHNSYLETQYDTEKLLGLHVKMQYVTYPNSVLDIAPYNTGGMPSYKFAALRAPYSHSTTNTGPFNVFSFGDYTISVGKKELSGTTETLYTDAGNITTNTNYSYNTNHLPFNTSITNSNNETISTDIKYPFDYTGNTVLTQMVGLNILNYPVEQISTKNTLPIKSLRTNYYNWNTSPAHIYPLSVDAKQGTNAYETRLNYNSYDLSGNVLTVSKQSDNLTSYIWDYLASYPVAQVVNAAHPDIAYTSFEADGKGNWTFSGATEFSTGTPTGKRYYNLTGGALTKAGLTSETTYIISYWRPATAGALTMAGLTPTTGRTANGWTYYEHKVSGIAEAVLSGTGLIDEVRLYPALAQMTTFTFEPLIGMTSQCDINNIVTYFIYDASNQLQLIKDQDGNILKKICYNYAGQVEDCTLNLTPLWTATGNLRCATSSGVNTGFQEREERDNNPSSTSFNQTQWITNEYNTSTCPLPAASCSFTIGSGFNLLTSGISSSAGIASFYIVFNSSNAMNPGNSYFVATVNGGCKPTTTRTISYSSSGRNWTIMIYPSGQMYWYLSPGSTSVGVGTTIGTGTLTYNL